MQLVAIGGHTRHVRGTCWNLTERGLTLGRDEDNDIVLDDPIVSRRHCRFDFRDGRVYLEDLGSRNPLLVNGLPLRSGVLEPGDEITIGTDRFLLARSGVEERLGSDANAAIDAGASTDTISIGFHRPLFLGAEQESPRTIHDLLVLQQLSTRLTRCSSTREVAELLKQALKERFNPLAFWVVLCNPEQEIFVLDQDLETDAALPTEAVQLALREKRGLLKVGTLGSDRSTMSFTLVTPVAAGGTAIGAIALFTAPPRGTFVDDDLRLLVLLGQSLGPIFWTIEDMEQLRRENEYLRARAGESLTLVGSSKAMREVSRRIGLAAKSELSVLIVGDTGTGKELAARLIHQQSARKRGPFVVVNCAAIPHELFESFMFGHERGAFTGAERASQGLLGEANGGTIFLDEIGDLSLDNQARILRSIEYGTYRRPGAEQDSRVDVRVVSATNRDLRARVKEGLFREDLFHRLNGFLLRLPRLREHAEDIPELTQHFFDLAKQRAKYPVRGVSRKAMAHLQAQPWSGNVRELRNCVWQAVSVAQGDTLRCEDLSVFCPEVQEDKAGSAGRSLAELERIHIAQTLSACGGNVSMAAKSLGISRSTLYERMRQYDL